jgi:hypothetical protein
MAFIEKATGPFRSRQAFVEMLRTDAPNNEPESTRWSNFDLEPTRPGTALSTAALTSLTTMLMTYECRATNLALVPSSPFLGRFGLWNFGLERRLVFNRCWTDMETCFGFLLYRQLHCCIRCGRPGPARRQVSHWISSFPPFRDGHVRIILLRRSSLVDWRLLVSLTFTFSKIPGGIHRLLMQIYREKVRHPDILWR